MPGLIPCCCRDLACGGCPGATAPGALDITFSGVTMLPVGTCCDDQVKRLYGDINGTWRVPFDRDRGGSCDWVLIDNDAAVFERYLISPVNCDTLDYLWTQLKIVFRYSSGGPTHRIEARVFHPIFLTHTTLFNYVGTSWDCSTTISGAANTQTAGNTCTGSPFPLSRTGGAWGGTADVVSV